MKHKLSFLLLYGVLVLFGGLGALLLIWGEKEPRPSETENRMLAGFPTLSADAVKDGSFMSGLEDYLSDNMPAREELVLQADLIMDRLSLRREEDEDEDQIYDQVVALAQEGTGALPPTAAPTAVPTSTPAPSPTPVPTPTSAPSPTVQAATPAPTAEPTAAPTAAPTAEPTAAPEKDLSDIGPCYFTYTKADGSEEVVYTFSPENVRRMIRTLNAYRAVLPADGHVFFAQPPFPAVARRVRAGEYAGWGGDLEKTINEYSDEGVYMVSVQKVLEQHLIDKEYLYFTTDHHWTPRAACYTANAILETMGIDPKPYDSYSFHVYRDFYGSAAGNKPSYRSSHAPDTLEVLIPTLPVKGYRIFWDGSEKEAPLILSDSHSYMAFLGGTLGPWRRFETGADTGRNCLVIGDSFANAFVPFLVPYYDTIHVTDVRSQYYDGAHAQWTISEHIRTHGVDDVYFILSTANGVNTKDVIEALLAYLN